MKDLTIDELKTILGWFEVFAEHDDLFLEGDRQLAKDLEKTLAEKEELESMDLDDCAGGACKL
jgi:hypothetical protein